MPRKVRKGRRRHVVSLVALLCAPFVCGCPAVPPTQDAGVDLTDGQAGSTPTDGTNPADQTTDPNASTGDDSQSGADTATADDTGGATTGSADTLVLTDNEYCNAVADWPADWVAWERQVLELVNARRAEGANCGASGSFDPADPLTVNGALTCAARNHSMDMAVRGYFDHTDPDGNGPGTRIAAAEYDWSTWGENIALGYPSPEAVVQGWMESDGHCANIMNAAFTEIGIGYYEGNYWTQDFGRPR